MKTLIYFRHSFFAIFFIFIAAATSKSTVKQDAPVQLYQDEIRKIEKANSAADRWKILSGIPQKINEYKLKHEPDITSQIRLDFAEIEVRYLPIIPNQNDFKLKLCPNYKTQLLSDSQKTSPSEFNTLESLTDHLIDLMCRK